MSVAGFDFGNENCVVAVAIQSGIDDDMYQMEIPSVVSFSEKQRFIGDASSSVKNPSNTISQVKRLIGRPFADPALQRDLHSLPFSVTEGPDGFPLIHVRYLGEQHAFTPTQVLGMILSHLKRTAEEDLDVAVVDCCIGIPVYFTDLQRRAVLDAAAIAGLHPLRLFHETTATALEYGISCQTDLPEEEDGQLNVAFVDVGHASFQVCIVGFSKCGMKVLAHAFDRSLGSRDFDEVLFRHFADKFKDDYGLDVYQNMRACQRLRAACKKLRMVLSVKPSAHLEVECLIETDVRAFIKRDDFERISSPILERVKGPLEKALSEAGIGVENVHVVKVVGSGSCIPAIIRILSDFFGKEPRRAFDAIKRVARGCALQCAMLSPTRTFKVREFQVNEKFPFPIALSWKGPGLDSFNATGDNQQSTLVFPKGNPIPSVKACTFHRSCTFYVDFHYADGSDLQAPSKISSYMIGPFQSYHGEHLKVKVKVHLNLHGIVSIESAMLLEEDEIPVKKGKTKMKPAKETTKMDTNEVKNDAAPADTGETDVKLQDPAGADDDSGVKGNNGVAESGARPVLMETEVKSNVAKNARKRLVQILEYVDGGMVPEDLQKAVDEEYEMTLQDRVMEETKNKKDAVKEYVDTMKDGLRYMFKGFVTDSERDAYSAKLQEVEDWLYEDGKDETKSVYIAKLEELKKQGDPIVERYTEYSERDLIIDQLIQHIDIYRTAAMRNHPLYDHIDSVEKQKVLNECREAEAWLREKRQQQDALPKYANPVLLVADIKRKDKALNRFCLSIMIGPEFEPAQLQTPSGSDGQASSTEPEQMDTDEEESNPHPG